MKIMSNGHKVASKIAFGDGALGVFVTPDLVLSDGSVKKLAQHVNLGKAVVLWCGTFFLGRLQKFFI